jgi:hypothetical protein
MSSVLHEFLYLKIVPVLGARYHVVVGWLVVFSAYRRMRLPSPLEESHYIAHQCNFDSSDDEVERKIPVSLVDMSSVGMNIFSGF